MLTLKVDSVQLEFDGRQILQDVYLQCSQGEIVGLLGRNGSGKSSLLKIIFGTLTPQYKYVGIEHNYIKKGFNNNRIAYLPQHNYLPKGIKISLLAKIMVDEFYWDEFTELPIYQNHYNKTVSELSGGELRKLETMMVVYNQADFILLDEPFTHISPIQTEEFKPILKRCAQRKGVIVTDHQYYNVLDISDRIILLNNGRTIPINSEEELVNYGYINTI